MMSSLCAANEMISVLAVPGMRAVDLVLAVYLGSIIAEIWRL